MRQIDLLAAMAALLVLAAGVHEAGCVFSSFDDCTLYPHVGCPGVGTTTGTGAGGAGGAGGKASTVGSASATGTGGGSPSCTDGIKNGDETDVDCGGSCLGCEGASCTNGITDCAGCSCSQSKCSTSTCPNNNSCGGDVDGGLPGGGTAACVAGFCKCAPAVP